MHASRAFSRINRNSPHRTHGPRGLFITALLALTLLWVAVCTSWAAPEQALLAPQPGTTAQAPDIEAVWQPLCKRLTADGLDPDWLARVFATGRVGYETGPMARKMNNLIRIKTARAKAKADAKKGIVTPPPTSVYKQFFVPALLSEGATFMQTHKAMQASVQATYGVPPEVQTAILMVETKLGSMVGKHTAVVTLASMAAATDHSLIAPHINTASLSTEMRSWVVKRTGQKANWAYKELVALLSHAYDNGHDPTCIPSSVYGAIGMCQFMPSNVQIFGRDGDADGHIDLFTPADAMHSLAYYLHRHGWKEGISHAKQQKAIYAYNRSGKYVRTVLTLADRLREITPTLSDATP